MAGNLPSARPSDTLFLFVALSLFKEVLPMDAHKALEGATETLRRIRDVVESAQSRREITDPVATRIGQLCTDLAAYLPRAESLLKQPAPHSKDRGLVPQEPATGVRPSPSSAPSLGQEHQRVLEALGRRAAGEWVYPSTLAAETGLAPTQVRAALRELARQHIISAGAGPSGGIAYRKKA